MKIILAFALLIILGGTLNSGAQSFTRTTAAMRIGEHGRMLVTAIHEYHADHKQLPPAAILSTEGKPLLSWRVVLLPYFGEEELYKEFKLDDPWDSSHNRPLLERVPLVYRSPMWCRKAPPGHTYFQLFVGPGACFELGRRRTLQEIATSDGTSNTLLGAWAHQAVPWTKPDDIPFAPDRPIPELGPQYDETLFPIDSWLRGKNGVRVIDHRTTLFYADGSIRSHYMDPSDPDRLEMLRPLITWQGGEQPTEPRERSYK